MQLIRDMVVILLLSMLVGWLFGLMSNTEQGKERTVVSEPNGEMMECYKYIDIYQGEKDFEYDAATSTWFELVGYDEGTRFKPVRCLGNIE